MGTAIITGGTGGLGRAIVAELEDAGMQVRALSRAELELTESQAVERFFREVEAPDLLVCAAGTTRDAVLARLAEPDWDQVLAVNLRAAFWCARGVLPGMIQRRSGHIVLVSSHSAFHPPAGQVAYAAAKAGLIGLTRSLAKEAGRRGVRVNAILPGFLETRMTAVLAPDVVTKVQAGHVLERFNTPAEVAAFLRCLHLQMKGTSGQTFALDSRIL